ncbi:hypothetical protein GCM10027190_08350 [Spirosoma areae]
MARMGLRKSMFSSPVASPGMAWLLSLPAGLLVDKEQGYGLLPQSITPMPFPYPFCQGPIGFATRVNQSIRWFER